MSKKGSLLADQRGAVAFEMIIVYIFMVIFLLLPLADVAIAGFRQYAAHCCTASAIRGASGRYSSSSL